MFGRKICSTHRAPYAKISREYQECFAPFFRDNTKALGFCPSGCNSRSLFSQHQVLGEVWSFLKAE